MFEIENNSLFIWLPAVMLEQVTYQKLSSSAHNMIT